jgi:hypothetical protein
MSLSSSDERRARLFDSSSLELRPTEQLLHRILHIGGVLRVCPSRDDRLLVICSSKCLDLEMLSIKQQVLELRRDLQEDDIICRQTAPRTPRYEDEQLQLHLLHDT